MADIDELRMTELRTLVLEQRERIATLNQKRRDACAERDTLRKSVILDKRYRDVIKGLSKGGVTAKEVQSTLHKVHHAIEAGDWELVTRITSRWGDFRVDGICTVCGINMVDGEPMTMPCGIRAIGEREETCPHEEVAA